MRVIRLDFKKGINVVMLRTFLNSYFGKADTKSGGYDVFMPNEYRVLFEFTQHHKSTAYLINFRIFHHNSILDYKKYSNLPFISEIEKHANVLLYNSVSFNSDDKEFITNLAVSIVKQISKLDKVINFV